jgi:hypothetical protein
MPLPDDNSSTDEDEPIHQDLSDADAVAEPIGSFSSLIDYDPANASDKSSRASLEPIDEVEQIPSVCVRNQGERMSVNRYSALSSSNFG